MRISHPVTCVHHLSSFLHTHLRRVWLWTNPPPPFSSSRLNQAVSASPHTHHLHGLSWACSSLSKSFLSWRSPNWILYPKRGLDFLDMLGTLFVRQLSTQPAFAAARACRPSSARYPPEHVFCKAAFSLLVCQPALVHGVILSHMQDFTFVFVEFMLRLAPLPSSKSFRPVWRHPTTC